MKMKMTQAEFARHLGVTRQAVSKMVKQGKIERDDIGLITVDEAKRCLGRSMNRSDDDDFVLRDPDAEAKHWREMVDRLIAEFRREFPPPDIVIPIDLVETFILHRNEILIYEIEKWPRHATAITAAAEGGERIVRRILKAMVADLRSELTRHTQQVDEELRAHGFLFE